MRTLRSTASRRLGIAPCALLLAACACGTEAGGRWRASAPALRPLVTPAQLAAIVARGEAIVFDVRPRAAFRQAHVAGAWPLPLDEIVPRDRSFDEPARARLASALSSSAFSADATIVVVGDGGESGLHRTAAGCWLLSLAGAHRCSVLAGSLAAFRDAGGVLGTGDPGPAESSETLRIRSRPFTIARFEEVRRAVSSPEGAFVDVRRTRTGGAIPGALDWPLPDRPAAGASIDLPTLRRTADDAGLLAERELVVVGEALEDGAWGWFLLRRGLGLRGARLYPGGIDAWRRSPSLPFRPG